MDKERIIEILNTWNFWNKDLEVGILRKGYLDKLLEFIKTDKIISIIGVRRSGKSTLIRQMAKNLIEKGLDRSNILIVNFEEPEFEGLDVKFLIQLYQAYNEIIKPKNKPYVFLDEIQNVAKWERFVRSLNEKKEAFLVISGSSSKLLSEELATVLTGRQLYFEVLPLSFSEFLNFNGLDIDSQKTAILNSLKIKRLLRDYLRFGGFPEVTLGKNEEFKKRILISYYEDIINRDLVQRFKIKKIDKLKSLVRFYLTNISNYVSFNRIAKFIQLPVETIRRFTFCIEASNLIFFIKRFSYSVKEQENSPRKVYSIDVGLSNAVGFRFSENYGNLAENIVALKLKKIQGYNPLMEIYYWKNQYGDKETDFLIKEGLKVSQAIQVCWDVSNPETKDRELKGLLKSMEEFKLKKGLIITEDFEGKEKIKDKEIIYRSLWKWLLDLDREKKGKLNF